ncbi:MAG: hypothetical protein AAF721_01540 [Myxococcota bacterium]
MSKKLIIGVGAGATLIAACFVASATLGAEVGQPCDKEWGCKGLDGVCLEGDAPMCSQHCEEDSECPDGWSCADVKVLTFDGKSQTPDESAAPVCLPAP